MKQLQPESDGAGWVKVNQSRLRAEIASAALHPRTYLRNRLRPRQGLSKKYDTPTSTDEVLQRLSALPISTWTYGFDDPSVKHLGPMSQDFAKAFGLGTSEVTIDAVDACGVALAAIQALHKQVIALETEVAELREATNRSASV